MTTNLLRLAILSTVVTLALMIGGVWWWALLGMTSEVGAAIQITAFMTTCGSAVAWAVWADSK